MKIFTHQNMDLDNASAVSLALRIYNLDFDAVHYVGADYDGTTMANDDVAIDIEANGKGEKGRIVTRGNKTFVLSAFSLVVEKIKEVKMQKAYSDLAVFIDALDSTGNWVTAYYPHIVGDTKEARRIPTILDTFFALKHFYGLNDLELLKAWKPIIDGLWNRQLSELRANKEAEDAEWPFDHIAIIYSSKEPATMSKVHAQGAHFIIYEDGNNLGVKRGNKVDVNLGKHLHEVLPDWFHHKAGFLSCWGSHKAPKSTPANISAIKLAEMVSQILY